jgi:hypothetical protein
LHAALHDRVFDADQFSKSCLEHFWPSVPPVRTMRTPCLCDFEGQDAVTPGKSPRVAKRGRAARSGKSGDFCFRGADNSLIQPGAFCGAAHAFEREGKFRR